MSTGRGAAGTSRGHGSRGMAGPGGPGGWSRGGRPRPRTPGTEPVSLPPALSARPVNVGAEGGMARGQGPAPRRPDGAESPEAEAGGAPVPDHGRPPAAQAGAGGGGGQGSGWPPPAMDFLGPWLLVCRGPGGPGRRSPSSEGVLSGRASQSPTPSYWRFTRTNLPSNWAQGGACHLDRPPIPAPGPAGTSPRSITWRDPRRHHTAFLK